MGGGRLIKIYRKFLWSLPSPCGWPSHQTFLHTILLPTTLVERSHVITNWGRPRDNVLWSSRCPFSHGFPQTYVNLLTLKRQDRVLWSQRLYLWQTCVRCFRIIRTSFFTDISSTSTTPLTLFLVVTSGLTSTWRQLTSDLRSPDEADEAAGSITRLRFVWFSSNFVHLPPRKPLENRVCHAPLSL